MMMKTTLFQKALALFLAASMTLATFAGCTSSPSPSADGEGATPAAPGAAEPEKGAVINVLFSNSGKWPDLADNWFDKFETDTGAKLNVELVPSASHNEKLMLGLAANDQEYDVFRTQVNLWGQMLESSWLLPLDEYIDAEASAEWKAGMEPSAIDACIYEDGKRYAIGSMAAPAILIYNQDLFTQAGLDPESPPKTLDALLQASRTIKEKTNAAGIAFRCSRENNSVAFFFNILLHLSGNGWYDVSGAKQDIAVLDQPSVIQTAQLMKDLADSGPDGILNYQYSDAVLALQQGNVAMMIDAANVVERAMNEEATNLSDQFRFSAFTEGVTMLDGWSLSIGKTTKYPQACWNLIMYITGKDVSLGQAESGADYYSMRTDVDYAAYQTPVDLAQAVKDAKESSTASYYPVISQYSEIVSELSINLSDMINGSMTPEQAMQSTNDEILMIMERDGILEKHTK